MIGFYCTLFRCSGQRDHRSSPDITHTRDELWGQRNYSEVAMPLLSLGGRRQGKGGQSPYFAASMEQGRGRSDTVDWRKAQGVRRSGAQEPSWLGWGTLRLINGKTKNAIVFSWPFRPPQKVHQTQLPVSPEDTPALHQNLTFPDSFQWGTLISAQLFDRKVRSTASYSITEWPANEWVLSRETSQIWQWQKSWTRWSPRFHTLLAAYHYRNMIYNLTWKGGQRSIWLSIEISSGVCFEN